MTREVNSDKELTVWMNPSEALKRLGGVVQKSFFYEVVKRSDPAAGPVRWKMKNPLGGRRLLVWWPDVVKHFLEAPEAPVPAKEPGPATLPITRSAGPQARRYAAWDDGGYILPRRCG